MQRKRTWGLPVSWPRFLPWKLVSSLSRVERAAGESPGPAAGGCNLSPSSDENTSLLQHIILRFCWLFPEKGRERERESSEWPWEGIELPGLCY